MYENPNSKAGVDDLSTVDLQLDKEGDDLPEQRLKEREFFHLAVLQRAGRLRDTVEPRETEASQLRLQQNETSVEPSDAVAVDNSDITIATSATQRPVVPFTWQPDVGDESRPDLEQLCKKAFPSDKFFQKILQRPKDHKSFSVEDGVIYYTATPETKALCIPHAKFRGRALTELVLDQVHRTVGHMAVRAMFILVANTRERR